MDRAEFATRLRKRLPPGAEGSQVAAEILADADELMAWAIEECARPHYGRWVTPARPARLTTRETLAAVSELPGDAS